MSIYPTQMENDIDVMRDVYMTREQRDAYNRIVAATRLERSLQDAAHRLTQGWQIHLTVEQGAAWVTYTDWDGKDFDAESDDDLWFSITEITDRSQP